MPSDIAVKIFRLRHAHALGQVSVASLLTMTARTYSDYERGVCAFTVEHIEKLSEFFRLAVGELLTLPDELVVLSLQRAGGGAKS